MRSRKMLLIILLVGLAIFVVSWAIGRPLWQAALFGIGFLLIAAIASSRGLLIPETLFSRRFPGSLSAKKPIEATDKDEFLKRMDSALADLSAQSGAETEDVQWTTEYTRIMEEVGELAYRVHESVRSKDKAEELRAFREAVKQLPYLISELKNIPEPRTPKRQKAMEHQVQGMDLYLLACSNFAEALEMSDGELAGEAAKQINEALYLLNIIDRPTAMPSW
jgi:predicted nucleic acid-binding protein